MNYERTMKSVMELVLVALAMRMVAATSCHPRLGILTGTLQLPLPLIVSSSNHYEHEHLKSFVLDIICRYHSVNAACCTARGA